MSVMLEVYHPVAEEKSAFIAPAPRLAALNGKKVGLFWNSKVGGEIALDEISRQLKSRFKNIEFLNFTATDFHTNKAFIDHLQHNKYDAFIASTAD